jgi:transposase
MQAIIIPTLDKENHKALEVLYQATKDVRLRTRTQIVLLSVEKQLKADAIAEIVRESHATVLRWLKRYLAEGLEGLADAPRSGRPSHITAAYREQLVAAVRQRPRSLGLEYSLWTCPRLADYLAEQTGSRVSPDTVERLLHAAGIVLSRPQHTISSPDPAYQVKKKRLKTSAST